MPVNSFDDYPMSWRPSLDHAKRPLYKELARLLLADIKNGTLLPGTKLPPQRELADFLDINLSTVSRAFQICSDMGILTSLTGSGTFIAYDAGTTLSLEPTNRPQIIELGAMMPETLSVADVMDTLSGMMLDPKRDNFFQYSYGSETWHLQAAQKLLRKAGIPDEQERSIFTSSGGQNAIAVILSSLFRPGDRIGVDPLSYPGFKSAARYFGIRLVPIQQEHGEMSEAGLIYAIKNYNIKGLYVTPDYQNPTMHIMSPEGRKMIAFIAKKNHLLVVEDAIASFFREIPLAPICSYAPDHTVYILSLSKALLPALRLAYILCPPAYSRQIQEGLHNINLSQSELLLELASRLIVAGKCDTLMAIRRPRIIQRNAIAEQILTGYELSGDRESLARWLILPDGLSGRKFEELAYAKNVAVYGDERFVVGNMVTSHGARLAIASPPTEELLRTGLTRIRAILDNYCGNAPQWKETT